MHDEILRQAVSTVLSWPLSGAERMTGEAAATTLLRAEVGGVLGKAPPEDRERLQSVLRSMSGFVQNAGVEEAAMGGPWRPWGQTQQFMRYPGRTAAESIRMASDVLWSHADEAVFMFRRGYTRGCTTSLASALHALQDSFSPAHVKRVKSEDGSWVIKDVPESAVQDPQGSPAGGETSGRAEDAEGTLSELGHATVLAKQLLLSYFVQRVLGLASEAYQTRQTLEGAYLREEAS